MTSTKIFAKGGMHLLTKRCTGKFGHYWREINESQWYDEEQLQELQNEKVRFYIKYAYNHVPYYRELLKELKLRPGDFHTTEDLKKLPILDKETLRRDGGRFVSRSKIKPLLRRAFTSGTTGTPLIIYRDLDNIVYEHAILQRQKSWAGVHYRDRCVTLTGEKIVPADQSEPPFWVKNVPENKLIMSSYHLSKANAELYIEALHAFQPVCIEGYPSSIYALARFMAEKNITLPVRAVFTTSETLSVTQRALIQKMFECVVYDYYGMAERVLAIHSCEYGRYHVLPEYGVAEFEEVSKRNGAVACELIGTALNNKAMPLFRYRLSDMVKLSDEKCPCGRAYPTVKSILGRRDDYIRTPLGTYVGRLDHIFKGAQNIIEAQIVQAAEDKIELVIVPDEDYAAEDEHYVVHKLQERVGSEMSVFVKLVKNIQRSSNGKFRAVVSQVSQKV